jgi:hypothetical protein
VFYLLFHHQLSLGNPMLRAGRRENDSQPSMRRGEKKRKENDDTVIGWNCSLAGGTVQ